MTKVQIVELAALIQTEHEGDVLSGLIAAGMQPVKRKQALTVNAKLAVFLFLVCAGVLSLLRSLMGYAGLRSRGYASLHHPPMC